MQEELNSFVEGHLSDDLEAILKSNRKNYLPQISNHAKAVIYAYSERGPDIFSKDHLKFLNFALSKLPDYKGICYRGIKKESINKYLDALKNRTEIRETGFTSSSKSLNIARQFSNEIVLTILSKKGKEIEKIAKFGIDDSQNESEVLFLQNTFFKVIRIDEVENKYEIILNEI